MQTLGRTGILGVRTGEDEMDASLGDFTTIQGNLNSVFKVVYLVPDHVKYAKVDISVWENQADTTGDFIAVDIGKIGHKHAGVLVQMDNDGAALKTSQVKGIILGPKDRVLYRGPLESNCVVTGIEYL